MTRLMRWRGIILRLLFVGVLLGALAVGGLATWLGVSRDRAVTLPAPTGRYAVGRVGFDWTDESRADPFRPQSGHRDLPVWVWYPSASGSQIATTHYLPPPWPTVYQRERGIGAWLWQNPDKVRAHAVTDAPPADGTFPVLVFEPGLGKKPFDYTPLLEDLASHGYVVAGIFPTDSTDVALGDGRIVPSVNAARDGFMPDQLIQIWTQDTRFVIDRLSVLQDQVGNALAGHLDLSRIGVLGHSFGGATAAEVCSIDARCLAGADLDGTPFGNVVQTGLATPFLFIRGDECTEGSSDPACQDELARVAAIVKSAPSDHYELEIQGAKHFNFSDMAVTFSPLARPAGVVGPIDGARALRITADYLTAFFDHYLNGEPAPLLRSPSSEYSEVRFVASPG